MPAEGQPPFKTIDVGRHASRRDRSAALHALTEGRAVVVVGQPRAVMRIVRDVMARMPEARCNAERPDAETAPGSGERARSPRLRARLFVWRGEPVVLDAWWSSAELHGDEGRRGHSR